MEPRSLRGVAAPDPPGRRATTKWARCRRRASVSAVERCIRDPIAAAHAPSDRSCADHRGLKLLWDQAQMPRTRVSHDTQNYSGLAGGSPDSWIQYRPVIGRVSSGRRAAPVPPASVAVPLDLADYVVAVSEKGFLMSTSSAMSPDFNLGDLVILQRSVFHPEYDGALAEIVDPEKCRGSVTPSGLRRPVQALYRVRVIAPVEGEVLFSVARYQLRPLDGVAFRRELPRAEPERHLRPEGSRPLPDRHGQGPRAQRVGICC